MLHSKIFSQLSLPFILVGQTGLIWKPKSEGFELAGQFLFTKRAMKFLFIKRAIIMIIL